MPHTMRMVGRARSTLLAALAVLLVPWLVGSCGSSGSPAPTQRDTTAAELAATMNAALRAADSMTGRGVVRLTTTLGMQAYAFSFRTTSQGDYRLETLWRQVATRSAATLYRRSLVIYNAGEHKLVTRSWEPVTVQPPTGTLEPLPSGSPLPPGSRRSVQTNVPSFAALPDGAQDLQGLGPLAPEFASTARAALAAQGNAAIAGSTMGGRAVWATTVPIPWPSTPTGRMLTHVRLAVDQASGLTGSMTLSFADGWRAQIEYGDLRPNAEVPRSAFDTSGLPGVVVGAGDSFRLVSLDEAEALAGVPALLPTFTLSGFSLSQVAIAETGRQGSFGRATDLWLVYRDGLESYQLRLQEAPFGMTPAWEDFAGLRRRDLDHGPFAGQPARTWVYGAAQGTFDFVGPGLFVENGQEVAREAGDLLPYEFWQVANSLKPYSP
jgi:outer membrane lipoprotein-sorting protein